MHGIAGSRGDKKLLVEMYKNRSAGFGSGFSYPADPFHSGGEEGAEGEVLVGKWQESRKWRHTGSASTSTTPGSSSIILGGSPVDQGRV